MGAVMKGFMGISFDLLLGKNTCEIFAAYWPHTKEYAVVAEPFNATVDPAIDDIEKAIALARRYANDPLWQGAEVVTVHDNIEVGKRIPVEKTLG